MTTHDDQPAGQNGVLGALLRTAVALLVAGTLAAQWYMLWRQEAWLEAREGWHWYFTPWPPALHLLPQVVGMTAAAFAIAYLTRRRPLLCLLVLIATGYGLQLGLAHLDGLGLDGLSRHMTHLAHKTFGHAATALDGDLSWVRDYEGTLSRYDRLGFNAKSKPPGTMLLYVATERLANLGTWDAPFLDRKARMADFAALSWPAVSVLVLLPVWWVGRRYSESTTALSAAALLVLVPPLQLMTLHVDQTWMPVLALSTIALGLWAASADSVRAQFAAGALFYLCLFVGFSLVGICIVLAVAVLAIHMRRGETPLQTTRLVATHAVCFALGLLVLHGLALLLLNYDATVRFERALVFHRHFKRWDSRTSTRLYFAVLNSVEWIHWVGIPVTALWLASAWRGVRSWRRPQILDALSLGLLITFLATALLGSTKAESARLWLWFAPLACLGAAQTIRRLPRPWGSVMFTAVLAAQLITTVLLRLRQDFQ